MSQDFQKPAAEATIDVNGVAYKHQDFFNVVDAFYGRVPQDEMLKVPFASVHDWPEHIERLTHFWWMKFGGKPYMFTHYNPVQKHYFAGFNQALLERWLGIFHQVLDEKLTPEQAALWKQISTQMGKGLSIRNEQVKEFYAKHPPDQDQD